VTSRGEERLAVAGRESDRARFDRLAGALYQDLGATLGME
jgi:hypothetical protein